MIFALNILLNVLQSSSFRAKIRSSHMDGDQIERAREKETGKNIEHEVMKFNVNLLKEFKSANYCLGLLIKCFFFFCLVGQNLWQQNGKIEISLPISAFTSNRIVFLFISFEWNFFSTFLSKCCILIAIFSSVNRKFSFSLHKTCNRLNYYFINSSFINAITWMMFFSLFRSFTRFHFTHFLVMYN